MHANPPPRLFAEVRIGEVLDTIPRLCPSLTTPLGHLNVASLGPYPRHFQPDSWRHPRTEPLGTIMFTRSRYPTVGEAFIQARVADKDSNTSRGLKDYAVRLAQSPEQLQAPSTMPTRGQQPGLLAVHGIDSKTTTKTSTSSSATNCSFTRLQHGVASRPYDIYFHLVAKRTDLIR